MMKRVLSTMLALVALGLLSWQAFFHIDFDADPLNLLPQHLPQVGAMRMYDEAFASQNDVLIAITQEDVAIGDEATASLQEYLAERKDLFQSLSGAPPWEKEPSQMGEMLAYLWVNGKTESLQGLAMRLQGDGVERELATSLDILENSMDIAAVIRVSHDPLHLSNFGESSGSFQLGDATRLNFVSDDGELRLILAEPANDLKGGTDVVQWQRAVGSAFDDWRSVHPELADGTLIQLTGRKIYMTEVTNALRRDLMISVVITLVFVVVLFGLLYRRVMPLVLLLVALYVTFVITLLLGEFIFQELGAMSVGFAAILMGLAVDYGFVIYQESCCSGKDPRELRPIFGRCIGWAAGTTACVFLFLNRSIMPGVTQLGTMVAIGIGVGALIMIFPYASALGRLRCYGHRNGEIASDARQSLLGSSFFAGWATAIGALMVVVVFYLMGFPKLNPDPESLLPEKRQASIELYKTVMERLGGDTRTLTVMGSSANDRQMLDILKRGKKILAADTTVTSAMIPTGLWPHIDLQNANRKVLAPLLEIEPEILAKAEAEGFTDEALLLTKRIFAAWREFVSHDQPFALKDPASEWLMKRLIQTDENSHLAIGFIRLVEDKFTIPFETIEALNAIGLRPIGWEFLGTEILAVLQHDIRHVVIPSAIVLLVLLAIVFRSVKGVCLSVALLVFSALGLMAVMRLIGMDWNIVNIAAAPLLLGLGLDYSIHVILALRRTHGNIPEIHRNIGRALLLCGTTTAVGFGSLRFARHGGLPMLGELCAIGILITMAVAIYLVPHWWCFLHRKELRERAEEDHSAVQSS